MPPDQCFSDAIHFVLQVLHPFCIVSPVFLGRIKFFYLTWSLQGYMYAQPNPPMEIVAVPANPPMADTAAEGTRQVRHAYGSHLRHN